MATFLDFQNGIGKRFKVVDGDGKPFSGLLGQHDNIIKVHTATQEVEGSKFIAHYSLCRFIQDMPAHLKQSPIKSINMDPKDQNGHEPNEEVKEKTSSAENLENGPGNDEDLETTSSLSDDDEDDDDNE